MAATVIIPAHNEENVLGSTLARLLDGLRDDVQVIVACNGCTDQTADVARKFGPRAEVLEINAASKVDALNAADAAARSFPRIYLDADIRITGEDMGRVILALEAPGALAAEPRAAMGTSRSSLWVKAFYAAWTGLHGKKRGNVGCGLFGLSEAGRARFGAFPAVISDDGYAKAHFAPAEIATVEDASTVVETPRNLTSLIKIKTRSRLGAIELQRKFPELWARKRSRGESLRKKILSAPRIWPLLPIYLVVQLIVRRRARRMAKDLDNYQWERDESSR